VAYQGVLYTVDVDILKPDTGYLSVIERPSTIVSKGTSRQSSSGSHSPSTHSYTEPLSEGEEDDDADLSVAKDEDKRTGLSGDEVKAAIAYREQMLKERREEDEAKGVTPSKEKEKEKSRINFEAEGNNEDDGSPETSEVGRRRKPKHHREKSTISATLKTRTLSIDPLAPSSAFDETLKTKLRGARDARRRAEESGNGYRDNENDEGGNSETEGENPALGGIKPGADDRILERNWSAPAGKKIAVPVRIEPKVYFAAERTFLVRSRFPCDLSRFRFSDHLQKWLNTAVFIGSIATTLLNFIPPDDPRGLISAWFFTLAALLSIAYAAGIFLYRSYRLRERRADGLYYDKYGPTVLCFVLFAALATNIGLRVSEMI
jgi:hypothetical protein